MVICEKAKQVLRKKTEEEQYWFNDICPHCGSKGVIHHNRTSYSDNHTEYYCAMCEKRKDE